MMQKLRPILVVILLISILILLAILSTGCGNTKLGAIVSHETICEDDCHNDMLDVCGSKYKIVNMTSIYNKNKIIFYCL